jgi:hypothetical protein
MRSLSAWLGIFALLLGLAAARAAPSAVAPASPVPAELQPWQAWVLDGHEARRCPWLMPGDPTNEHGRVCAWPGPLDLVVDAGGGHFSQRWQVEAESWLMLPGSAEHWPERVTVDGAPAAVVARGGTPALRLGPGSHAVTGEFRWSRRPEVLPVPASIGLVSLTVGGSRIASPQRTEQGVFLGRRAAARQEDQLELRVFRRLTDDQPSRLLSHLEISVAGDTREIRLPGLLPKGFVPLSLESELTARLDPDNTLRVQLRPGRYTVEIDARGPSPVESVALESRPAPWPAEEIWSFAGVDRLRVAVAEGSPAVDPAVANVPGEWRTLPAFAVSAGGALRIVERTRGLATETGNELRLERRVWLDFAGDGYTVVDSISGAMRRGWRLDLAAPYALASARTGDTPLLVTMSPAPGAAGVELRTPTVGLTTVARVPRTLAPLAATGWRERFAHASGELIVPPAYRLLAAIGPDSAPGTWVARWHLLDLFVVLLATVTAWRLLGWRATALTLVTLTLTHQEPGAPVWLWLNALIALALLRAAPAGRLQQVATAYQLAALALVAVVLVPFAAMQVRLAVYPQLEAEPAAAQAGVALQRFSEPVPADRADILLGARNMAPPPAMLAEAPASAPVASATVESEPEADNDQKEEAAAGVAHKAAVGSSSRVPSQRLSEIMVTGARRIAGYEPGALTQSGPGLPRWQYRTYRYGWNGPVEAGESVRFVISPPWLTRLWRVLGAVLSVLLLVSLAAPARPVLRRVRAGWVGTAPAVVAIAAALCGAPGPAEAAATPDPAILEALGKRLLAPPRCAPSCADVTAASVEVGPGRLSILVTASALDPVGVALPNGDPNWVPDRVEVDGIAAGGVFRDASGGRFVPLPRGRHLIRVEGSIAGSDTLSIAFPARPHVIDVSAAGWEVGGVADRRLLSGALELARHRATPGAAGAQAPQSEFPPFVTVARNIRLGHDWAVDTQVNRVAPASGAFTAKVPLLAGEEPVTPDLVVNARVVSVGFGGAEDGVGFSSTLPQSDTLELTAASDAAFTEIWRFDVGPSWHVAFDGLPAIEPEIGSGDTWRFEYAPRAGERLVVHVTRPAAVSGATLAYDRARLEETIGARARDSRLFLEYRSTQGGRQLVTVPADAHVTMVRTDTTVLALRPERGVLSIPAVPGTHTVEVRWQAPSGIATVARSSTVSLSEPASNVAVSLSVPDDRWVLYAFGPGIGPAVLYWGELLVFLAIAVIVGRSGRTPLTTQDWLLLGLGLSTFSWLALALFAAFVLVFQARRRTERLPATAQRFNLMQLGLAALAIGAFVALVMAVPKGLLSSPNMRIAGAHVGNDAFEWFIDQTRAEIPAPGVISVSLWWYKLAILAWALWLSFALTRWVRWAWDIFRQDGLWRGRVQVPSSTPPRAAATED